MGARGILITCTYQSSFEWIQQGTCLHTVRRSATRTKSTSQLWYTTIAEPAINVFQSISSLTKIGSYLCVVKSMLKVSNHAVNGQETEET